MNGEMNVAPIIIAGIVAVWACFAGMLWCQVKARDGAWRSASRVWKFRAEFLRYAMVVVGVITFIAVLSGCTPLLEPQGCTFISDTTFFSPAKLPPSGETFSVVTRQECPRR